MTHTDSLIAHRKADQFGRSVAMRLSSGAGELPYDVRERLRAARVRALEARKTPAVAPVVVARGATAALALHLPRWLYRIGSVLPLVVLAAGLVLIHTVQTERRASELAEVDTALLTDDLPPAAYADPGFVQFLKQSGRGE